MIHLLGLDHWLQEYELYTIQERDWGGVTDEETAYRLRGKSRLYDLIEAKLRSGELKLVAEECSPNQDTIARRLAAETGVAYLEIDMNRKEREAAEIPPNYLTDSEESKARGIRLRETHMAGKILSGLGQEENALLVCGSEHLAGLQAIFAASGHSVTTENVALQNWATSPSALRWKGFLHDVPPFSSDSEEVR
jgi:hypothetical protein